MNEPRSAAWDQLVAALDAYYKERKPSDYDKTDVLFDVADHLGVKILVIDSEDEDE